MWLYVRELRILYDLLRWIFIISAKSSPQQRPGAGASLTARKREEGGGSGATGPPGSIGGYSTRRLGFSLGFGLGFCFGLGLGFCFGFWAWVCLILVPLISTKMMSKQGLGVASACSQVWRFSAFTWGILAGAISKLPCPLGLAGLGFAWVWPKLGPPNQYQNDVKTGSYCGFSSLSGVSVLGIHMRVFGWCDL